MVSAGPEDRVIDFSKRFSLAEMSGTFSSKIRAGLASVDGMDGPVSDNGHDELRKRQAAAGTALYDVPYGEQTELPTKYAPMAKLPGTKITKSSATPLFPTSDYVLATTFLPIPTVVQTLTQSQTFSTKSMENTVCVPPACFSS